MARNLISDRSIAATSGSAVVLAADPARSYLLIGNSDVAVNVYLNMVGGTAVAHASGSLALAPLAFIQFDTFVPTNAISAITSGGSAGLTIYTNP